MKNAQKPETSHLGKLIKDIKKGHFVIPDFQREFDWQPWDIRDLIKSIFLDYYIGSLLLWEEANDNYKKLSCEPLYAFEGKLNPEYIVLDGQQRLTALHYVFFNPIKPLKNRKNKMYFYIDIEELAFGNEDEAFAYHTSTKKFDSIFQKTEEQYNHCLFPLFVMGEGLYEIEKWFKNFETYWKNEILKTSKEDWENEEETKENYLKRINQYIKASNTLKVQIEDLLDSYEVSYISLSKNIEIGKVCEIFTHINQKGVKLDTFDLLNAISRPKNIYLKQMYRESSNILEDNIYPGFEMKSHILMVMSILEQNYCSPKYLYYLVPNETKKIKNTEGNIEEIILIKDSETFISKWDNAVLTIDKTLKSLKNARDFGAIKSNFLPYPSIVPALSAIKDYISKTNLKNEVDIHSKIKKWYWASIFGNRYSSSVESTSTKDYLDLKKWFNDEDQELECVTDFYREYKNIDLHKEGRSSSAIYKAIFNLFILNEARDWKTFELPEYDTLDDHHIVPKSWGKNKNLGMEINTILNRAPLSSDTNRKIIRDTLPNVYLKDMFENNEDEKVFEVLQSHLISRKATSILLRNPFNTEDYREFINERKQTILQEINNRILSDKPDLPENLKIIDNDLEELELDLRNCILEKMSIYTFIEIKEQLPQHIIDKVNGRIERERKKNPSLVEEKKEDVNYWMSFSDLQELQQIITSKTSWHFFEALFVSKDKFTNELNDIANLRNSIRHSREVDKITQMKGQASILWFKQQL